MKYSIIYKNGKFWLRNYHVLFASDSIYEVCTFAIKQGRVFHDKSFLKMIDKGQMFYCTHLLEIKYAPADFYLLSNFPDKESAEEFIKPNLKLNPVRCEQDGKTFDSMSKACSYYGIALERLSKHLSNRGAYKTVKGLTFSRA